MNNEDSQPMFFPVSRFKLFVMSLVTLGLYQIFWFYKNWQLFKAATGDDISPFWRAVFNGIFCYSLITKIRNRAKLRGIDANFSPFLLTLAWFGLALCARLPDPYWLVSFLSVIVLLPVQEIVNELNSLAAPNHNPNDRFSVWNIVTIAVGGSLFVLAIVGTLMPAT
ncbi:MULTISPECIES: hypothetical protein [unclassified Microcoleus]|uniref:hypothetical protein n=1 Tax=unclassified Microcoleus TaxID=2642155 RepID=UPI002FCE71FF